MMDHPVFPTLPQLSEQDVVADWLCVGRQQGLLFDRPREADFRGGVGGARHAPPVGVQAEVRGGGNRGSSMRIVN